MCKNFNPHTSMDTKLFRDELRKQVLLNARGKSGVEVARALLDVTDEMEKGGIDKAWDDAPLTERSRSGYLFCTYHVGYTT